MGINERPHPELFLEFVAADPEKQHKLDIVGRNSKQLILEEYESYPEDHPLTRFFQDRLSFVSGEMLHSVLLLNEEKEIACILTDGTVIVSRGIVEPIITNLAATDALFSHETEHAANGDLADLITSRLDKYFRVGHVRGQEIRAEMKSARRLDTVGSNPKGVLDLLEGIRAKRQVNQKEKDPLEIKILSPFQYDVEHGSLTDRIIDLRTAGIFEHLFHLSHDTQPTGYTAQDFENIITDEERWSIAEQLSSEELRYFIKRQMKKSDVDISRVIPLISIEMEKLFTEKFPNRSREEQFLLTYLVAFVDFELAEKPAMSFLHTIGGETTEISNQTFSNFFDAPEKIQMFTDMITQGDLDTLEIYTPSYSLISVYEDILAATLDNGIFTQVTGQTFKFDISGFRTSTNSLRVSTEEWLEKNQLYSRRYSYKQIETMQFYYAFERMLRTEQTYNQELVDFAVELNIPIANLFPMKKMSLRKFDSLVAAIRKKHAEQYAERPEMEQIFHKLLSERFHSFDTTEYDPVFMTSLETQMKSLLKVRRVSGIIEDMKQIKEQHIFNPEDFYAAGEIIKQIFFSEEAIFSVGTKAVESLYHQKDTQDIWRDDRTHIPELLSILSSSKGSYLEDVNELYKILLPTPSSDGMYDLKTLDSFIHAIMDTSEGSTGQTWDEVGRITKKDLGRIPNILLEYQYSLVFHASKRSAKQILLMFVHSLEQYPLYRLPINQRLEKKKDKQAYDKAWNITVQKLLQFSWNMDSPDHMRALMSVCCLSQDTQVLLQGTRGFAKRYVELVDFETGLQNLTHTYMHLPRIIFQDGFAVLDSEKAQTTVELDRLESIVQTAIEESIEDASSLTQLAYVDAITATMMTDTDKMLNALLHTKESEQALAEYIFDSWYTYAVEMAHGNSPLSKILHIGRYGTPYQINEWINELPPPQEGYKTLSYTLRSFYLLDSQMKYLLLRRLLTGEHGVLSVPEKREQFLETFLHDHIDTGNSPETEAHMRTLLSAPLAVGKEEELFAYLYPALSDLILRFPEKPLDLQQVAIKKSKELLAELFANKHISRDPDPMELQITATKLYVMMTGQPWTGMPEPLSGVDSEDNRLLSYLPLEHKPQMNDKFTPLAFSVEVGQRDTVLLKTLQNSLLYLPFHAEERPVLYKVYDKVPGVSRLVAYRFLKRVAAYVPQTQDIVEHIVHFGQKIGGGSEFGVFKVQMSDGRWYALGIQTPNTVFHTEETQDFLRRVNRHLLNQDPNNLNYHLFGELTHDVAEHIHRDLMDPFYEENYQIFYEQNNDGRDDDVAPGMKIRVPEMVPTGTPLIWMSEFVDGVNLTELTLTDSQTDVAKKMISQPVYRSMLRLVARQYMKQIFHYGKVHSDIHPGNLRIGYQPSAAGEIEIFFLDNRGIITLTDTDQQRFTSLMTSLPFGAGAAQSKLLDILMTIPENEGRVEETTAILANLHAQTANVSPEDAIIETMLLLKKQQIKIPLDYTTILKNILLSLSHMGKDAGIASVFELFF